MSPPLVVPVADPDAVLLGELGVGSRDPAASGTEEIDAGAESPSD